MRMLRLRMDIVRDGDLIRQSCGLIAGLPSHLRVFRIPNHDTSMGLSCLQLLISALAPVLLYLTV